MKFADVLHNMSITVLLPWQHTGFQPSLMTTSVTSFAYFYFSVYISLEQMQIFAKGKQYFQSLVEFHVIHLKILTQGVKI